MNIVSFLKLLDPLQWFVSVMSIAGAVLCLWSFIVHEDFKFIKASFFVYTLLLVCRYTLIAFFRFDVMPMSVSEADLTNKISTILNMYVISLIIISMITLAIRETKNKKRLMVMVEGMKK